MALYGYGVNYAKTIDPKPENIIDPGVIGGKLRVHQDTFTISGAAAMKSDDYVTVGGKLPAGSQVVKIVVQCSSPALSTNSRMRIGDGADDDRYMSTAIHASICTVTAGAVRTVPVVTSGMYYRVSGTGNENYIRSAAGGGTETITTGTVKVSIFYVVE